MSGPVCGGCHNPEVAAPNSAGSLSLCDTCFDLLAASAGVQEPYREAMRAALRVERFLDGRASMGNPKPDPRAITAVGVFREDEPRELLVEDLRLMIAAIFAFQT